MDNKTKTTLIGVGLMVIGTLLVSIGLFRIPLSSVFYVIVGGVFGFVGYTIYKKRKNDPKDLVKG